MYERERVYIKGYEGLYSINILGEIYSHLTLRVLKPILNSNGYCYVTLYKKGIPKQYRLHKIVATTFLKNNEGKLCINHINLDKTDNRVVNLEWCTNSENNFHFTKNTIFNFSGKRKKHLDTIRLKTLSPIIQYDKNGDIIGKYDSIVNASKSVGVSASSIQNCVCGQTKSAGGFIWTYNRDHPKYN